jgi:glutamate synthase (NADPH) small chain
LDKENTKKRKVKVKMPELDVAKRANSFSEVALGYSEEDAINESLRCIQCKKPTCIEGCPVEIDIKSFIKLIALKDFDGALEKIREKNTLPAICGRVCPQEEQCEKKCIVGLKNEPVAIGRLERFVADRVLLGQEDTLGDWAKENIEYKPNLDIKAKETNNEEDGKVNRSCGIKCKMAVVGAGPAGLTCAGELAKIGYDVTIYEALHDAGGVLIYGIPEFRLPKNILKKEVDYLKALGVKIELNALVGKTITVPELLSEGCGAVFIATGAGLPYFMNIEGENLNGVYSANEFLTRINLMKAYLFPEWDTPIKKVKNIAVVGGGNVAMDSARCAKRLGAEHVYLIYRRSEKEMPARIEEVIHAKEEGIEFMFLTNPVAILGENGEVKKVRNIRMELGEPDSSGRRRPVEIKGSEFELDIEAIVIAIGQGPNPLLLSTMPDLKLNKWGNIDADVDTCKTNMEGIFAGGDIVTGAATVILAMGAGKVAARQMDEYARTKKW